MLPRLAAVLVLLLVATACGASHQATESNQPKQPKPDNATRDLVARTSPLVPELKAAVDSLGPGLPPVGAAHSAFVAAAPKTLRLAVRLADLSKRASTLAREVRLNGQPGTKKLARLLNSFAHLFTFEARQRRALAAAMTTRQPNVRVFCNLDSQLAENRAWRAFFDEARVTVPNPRAFARAI